MTMQLQSAAYRWAREVSQAKAEENFRQWTNDPAAAVLLDRPFLLDDDIPDLVDDLEGIREELLAEAASYLDEYDDDAYTALAASAISVEAVVERLLS